MPLPSGHQLKQYTIDKILGKGGFGVTYRAWDSRSHCYVAIKENYPGYLVKRNSDYSVRVPDEAKRKEYNWTLKHFKQEANLLRRLNHHSIVQVKDVFELNETCYYVMELLNAQPLSAMKGASFWPEKKLRSLLEQILSALSHMHAKDVYHRDLKPANIMVRTDGSPVIIDFGAAKHSSFIGDPETRGFVSQGYTALEQMADPNHLSPAIDIYSLGACIYCLLTGAPPPNAATRKINDTLIPATSHPLLNRVYSPFLLQSIDRALELSAADRFANAEQWKEYLLFGQNKTLPLTVPHQSIATPPSVSLKPAYEAIPPRASRGSAKQSSLRSSGDIVPLSTVFYYISNVCFITSGFLLLGLIISFASSSSGSSSLDSFFPLLLILSIIGFILRYLMKMDSFK